MCPCCSKKPYAECCKSYHEGMLPENALKLMRSRYSAYALGLADYILKTALFPPKSKQEILEFSKSTHFDDLTILEFIDGEKEAYVTFRAHLAQAGRDVSFTEKSSFLKEHGKWLYKRAEKIT